MIRLTIRMKNNFILFVKIIIGHRIIALRRHAGTLGVALIRNVEQKQLHCSFEFLRAVKLG